MSMCSWKSSVILLSLLLFSTCNADNQQLSKSTSLSNSIQAMPINENSRKFLEALSHQEEETGHPKHEKSLTNWQLWVLLPLVFLIMFLIAIFFRNLKSTTKSKSKTKEIPHESPSKSSSIKPIEEVVIKPEEDQIAPQDSELVFFVDEDERFRLDDLLEGAADLRTQGFYSSLYIVHLSNNVLLVVKRLKMLKVSLEEFHFTMRRIGNLKHPNILPLICYNSTPEEKLLIYKYQRNGSLLNLFENYAEGKRSFPWKLRLSIAVGIARGLDFIHQKTDHHNRHVISHGNIKLSNIMLDDNEEPLISEYGYAKFLDQNRGALFSNGYTAPEKQVSEMGDVYSFGVILLELLTGKTVEKSGLDLPKWVRAIVREEWTGEVFDEAIADVEMYAFPLLNVSLKCVANERDERPRFAEVLEKIEEIVSSASDTFVSFP